MRILRGILLSIFILVTVSQWCLGMYFRAGAPTTPDYDRGAIYSVRIQGSVVYLTRVESFCYNHWIFDIGFFCGAPVILYEVLARRKRSNRAEVPPQA